ncbi:MAG: response regulator transcription factor [Saprospiraceae bacterium]|nr:response regulator transcription factor [Saprospiraceae bacterium]
MQIILFDDNQNLRESIRVLLDSEPDLEVTGDYGSAENIVEIINTVPAQVIIMDIDMPGINGIEAVRLVKALKPSLEIIMLTVFEDEERLYASICAGASGYLLKMQSLVKLPQSIREVKAGGAPMSPGIARKMIGHFQSNPEIEYRLSEREKEILQWLVKGYSYKMIAANTSISIETVKTHLKNVYKKLHVNCATEAVAKVLKEKLI